MMAALYMVRVPLHIMATLVILRITSVIIVKLLLDLHEITANVWSHSNRV